MSELKETLFGEGIQTAQRPETEEVQDMINEQITFDDAYEPTITDYPDEILASPTPEEMIRDSMNAVERMKQEIAEETRNIDKRFAEQTRQTDAQPRQNRRPVYVIGVLSAAASLIFMSVALLITVNTSPIGAYAAIRLSPLMLLFLGAEIIFAVVRKHSLRIKIDIRSIIIIVSLIAISAVLSVVSVVSSSGTGERVYAEQRIQNMLANELRDAIAEDYIKSVDIDIQLYGDNASMYTSPADLTDGDIIDLTVNFSDAGMTIREFAKDCKDIMNGIKELPYNFGTIVFIADDRVNHYVLDVDWHYRSGFSAEKLAGLVNYYSDGISSEDIPDAIDDDSEDYIDDKTDEE